MPPSPVIVVMPVYNEEACIRDVATSWLNVLSKLPNARLLIINDGSKDGTAAALDDVSKRNANLIVIHQKNAGHGPTVINGYRQAMAMRPEYIFQADSDDQFEAEDFFKLWERRKESPFILGRRKNRHDPWHRIIASYLNRCLLMAMFGVWIKDPNVPFRLMRTENFATLFGALDKTVFAPNIFLSLLARKSGINTLDIPVRHKIRTTGVPSLNLKKWSSACLRCVKETARMRRALNSR